MANKIGNLIRQARTDAGLTQEQLARKVKGASSSDISKAERGELKLSQEQLKQIAKATGVTQKSLLDAAASSSYKASTASGKKTSSTTSKKTSSSSGSSMKVTAAERKLVELYRAADTSVKKKAVEILKQNQPVSDLQDTLGTLLDGALDLFSRK